MKSPSKTFISLLILFRKLVPYHVEIIVHINTLYNVIYQFLLFLCSRSINLNSYTPVILNIKVLNRKISQYYSNSEIKSLTKSCRVHFLWADFNRDDCFKGISRPREDSSVLFAYFVSFTIWPN